MRNNKKNWEDVKLAMTNKKNSEDGEFHVQTPKDDGGKKKKMKYGWMVDKQGMPVQPSHTKKMRTRQLDAVFIAPSFAQSLFYAKALNYIPANCLLLTPHTYEQKLRGITPDEDLPVHVCGSWIVIDEDYLDAQTQDDLYDVTAFLEARNFSYERVPEIGKPT